MQYSIEVKQVSKSYGKLQALNKVSFQVESGSLFALLGPNGAGKSTLIDIISTLLQADQGTVIVNGYNDISDIEKIRNSIGVVFQSSMLDDILTVEENLILRCGFYNLFHAAAKKRVLELSEMVDIKDILHQKTSTLSGGQHRRVDIARALIANPKVLMLDEPTTGLDPSSRDQIWKTISKLQQEQQMTVFLTTHYLEEARHANKICIMQHGNIIASGTPQDIRETYASDHLYLYSSKSSTLEKQLCVQQIRYRRAQNHVKIDVKNSMQALSILKRLERWIDRFEVIAGTLDDAFLNLMKGDEEDVDDNPCKT